MPCIKVVIPTEEKVEIELEEKKKMDVLLLVIVAIIGLFFILSMRR